MPHEQPLYSRLGDSCVSVSFSDTISLNVNFRVHAIADALIQRALHGVVEVIPHIRSVGVVFDRQLVDAGRIERALRETVQGTDTPQRMTSRRMVLPVWYDDPWSSAVARKYEVPDNLDFVAQANGIDRQEVIARHTGTDFWIAAVGFVPGCYWALALDESMALSAPKYATPRDFTPSRTMALAGLSSTIYPYAGPGGYQCIGRTPVEMFRTQSADPLYASDGGLVRRCDRHRYRAIGALEYEDIRERVLAGTYKFEIEEGEFDLATQTL